MNIILGTNSRIKIAAIRAAMNNVGWNGMLACVSVPSGVPEQPVEGDTELGAYHRALQAHIRRHNDLAIGIENGIRHTNNRWEDWAVIVIILPNGDVKTFHSDAIEIPAGLVIEARKRNITVGAVVAEVFGCSPNDPHSVLTNGIDSREAILTRALINAFIAVSRQP